MMLPTNQILQYVEHWLQKARASESRTVYALATRLAEQAAQLKKYRYGRDGWIQAQADEMKEGIGKLLYKLIEILAEQDGEALQFCNRINGLQEKEKLLYKESRENQVHSVYYRYLALYVHQAAERLDLDEDVFHTVSDIVEKRPR